MIYFIQQGRHIKIGVSADPWRRVADFQTAAPQRLGVLAIAPGDRAMERELHLLFAADRTGGEWFRESPRLLALAAFFRETFPELQERPPTTLPLLLRVREEVALVRTRLTCPECGKEFWRADRAKADTPPGSAAQIRYCSKTCKRRAANRRHYTARQSARYEE